MESIPITNNKQAFRFETSSGPDSAYIEYRWLKGDMALMHTFVPSAMRGKGIADHLAAFVFQHLRAHHLKAVVYCAFLKEWLLRHPEYDDAVSKSQ